MRRELWINRRADQTERSLAAAIKVDHFLPDSAALRVERSLRNAFPCITLTLPRAQAGAARASQPPFAFRGLTCKPSCS